MTHGEFIAKFDRYLPAYNYYFDEGKKSSKATAEKFGISPLVAGIRVAFVANHLKDPRCEFLSDCTHYAVMQLSKSIDLSDPKKTRVDLVNKYKAKDTLGAVNRWPDNLTKSQVRRLLDSFGIEWFELDGFPYVHWNET